MSTPTPIVYGIPNCDTVKKARAWLAGRALDAGWGYTAPSWVGAALVAGGLGLGAVITHEGAAATGELGLDMYGFRQKLTDMGLKWI